MKRRSNVKWLALLVFLFVLSACALGLAQSAGGPDPLAPLVPDTQGGPDPLAPLVPDAQGEPDPLAPLVPDTKDEPDPLAPLVPDTKGELLDCNWTLEVSDTKTTKLNGYDFVCTLSVTALKLGGTDEFGTYKGIFTLDYQFDMNRGNVSANASGGGQEIDAIIEVVKYNEEAYSSSANQTELAPLVAYDAMAIGSMNLSGGNSASENSGGASWNTKDDQTTPVPYRMTVDGGQVTIELYTMVPGVIFTGMITGTPL